MYLLLLNVSFCGHFLGKLRARVVCPNERRADVDHVFATIPFGVEKWFPSLSLVIHTNREKGRNKRWREWQQPDEEKGMPLSGHTEFTSKKEKRKWITGHIFSLSLLILVCVCAHTQRARSLCAYFFGRPKVLALLSCPLGSSRHSVGKVFWGKKETFFYLFVALLVLFS